MVRLRWARHLSWGLLAWVGGVALQLQQAALWPWWGYALLAALALLLLRGRHVLAHGLGWVVLSLAVTGVHALWRSDALPPELEGLDLDVVGVVQAMPQRQDVGWRFRLRLEQAWRGGQPVQVPDQVYLGWYAHEGSADAGWNLQALPEPVRAGERWRLRVRLKAAHGQRNPRGFDQELWLWEQGIHATGHVRQGRTDPPPQRLEQTWQHPMEWWRQSVRDRLLAHVSAGLGGHGLADAGQTAGIMAALVVGDQAAIDRSAWDVFRATGVAHLMSISGLHVTMFAWLASALVAWCWRRSALWGRSWALCWPAPHVGVLAGLGLASFYALFSGWGVPAQRTVYMLAAVVALRLSARQWPVLAVWLLAAVVVLTLDPWAALQAGFWLSFVAVGVLLGSGGATQNVAAPLADVPPMVAPSLSTKPVPDGGVHRYRARNAALWAVAAGWARVWGLLREQAVVTLALAPLCVLFFGQLSLVGCLANLLAIPWVTLVVTPLALLGVVWPAAWGLCAWALEPLVAVLGWMASWPLASLAMPVPPLFWAALALLAAVLWVLPLPLSWKLAGVSLALPAALWVSPRPALGTFELLVADVGQGNAVLVRTAHHSLLYDAGPRYSPESDAGHRVLVPLLAQLGERLDVLMLSHRDTDHTGGAAAVLAMQPEVALWSSLEDEHPLHTTKGRWTRCAAGQSWVWDGVRFEVLHPTPPGPQHGPARAQRPNAVSCVLRIASAQASALLTGDIEAPQEQALLAAGLEPVDVLLVPHHGSKTSSSGPFLERLQPRWALVQAGYRNRFGHPAPGVVARYRAQGLALVTSPHCGAAHWRSDAPQRLDCERLLNMRYWHHRVPP